MCKCVYVHTQTHTHTSVNAFLSRRSVWIVSTRMRQLRSHRAHISHSTSHLSRLVSAGNVLTGTLNITEHRNRRERVCVCSNRRPTQMFITTKRATLSKHVEDSLILSVAHRPHSSHRYSTMRFLFIYTQHTRLKVFRSYTLFPHLIQWAC